MSRRPALDDLATPALVLAGPGVDLGPVPDGVVVVGLGQPVPDEKWTTVLLAVADETGLRTAVSALPPLGRAKHVACHLGSAAAPVTTVLRPEWPPLANLVADTADGGALTRMRFRRPAPATPVLVELARHTGTPATSGNHGLVVEGFRVPVDPTVVSEEVPASVVAAGPVEDTPVLGRQAVVIEAGTDPLDEALLNPVGFRRDWDRGPVPMPTGEPTPAMVAALRDTQAVVVPPDADPRTVAGLAMAGVPLITEGYGEGELDDPQQREEHSVRLRRAALREHSGLGWRRRIGAEAGVRVARDPSVTVVRPGTEPGPLTGDVVVVLDEDVADEEEVVADLLLALSYSGADLVGVPSDGPAERFGGPLADAPLAIERGLLRAVGGLGDDLPARVRAAGGLLYATRGPGHPRA